MKSKREKLPNKIELEPAVERQKKYAASMGIALPECATKSDATALINRDLDNDEAASSDLIAYARQKDILCSDYVGEKYLHNLLFDHLSPQDKAAFFCFCVYKFHFNEENENLYEHPFKQKFEEFGENYAKDYYFTASLDEYYGEELIAFGKSTKILPNGKKKNIYGGSIYTRAYKEAYSYIKDNIC